MRVSIIAVATISWLLSIVLLVDLWRRTDNPPMLRIMLALALLIPVLGPLIYLWTRSFPAPNDGDLVDQQRYELDVLNRWRGRFERAGWLPRRWSLNGDSNRRRTTSDASESIYTDAHESIAEANARAAARKSKAARRARLHQTPTKKR